MDCHLILEGFRSFQTEKRIPIRPVTVFVGENSSGKSSVLAALRYVCQWIGGNIEPSFNSEPFFLGSFRDIANYRGGRAGRSQKFSIGLEFSELVSGKRSPQRYEVRLTFANDGDGLVDRVVLTRNKEFVAISAINKRLQIQTNIEDSPIDSGIIERMPPFDFMRTSLRSIEQIAYYLMASLHRGEQDRFDSTREFIFDIVRTLRQRIPNKVFSSGAVRTEPQRSYDPTKALSNNDPNTEIYRMALAMSTSKEAREIKERILDLGRKSGLFSDIEFRSLGRSSSDPFQIIVNASGRKFNIVDVGYGVSQVLPIAFRIQQLDVGSVYLLQQPEVHLHPSAQAALATWLVEKVSSLPLGWIIIETHSDFIVDRILKSISDKVIESDKVALNWFRVLDLTSLVTRINISQTGEVLAPPMGYRRFFLDEMRRNLGV